LEAGAISQGVLQDAQQRLQALLQDTPDDPNALHALALTELKLGDTAEAMRHLDMAIAAAPQELMIAVTLAQAKLEQKDAKGAEAILLKACQNSPKSVDAVVILGQFYFSQNKTTEAEQQFQRALAMDPNNGGALLNLAVLQYQTGRKREAELNFKRLSSMPASKAVYAVFLLQEGRRDEAIREFERLVQQDPNDRMARTRLVAAYRLSNRVQDAQALLERALKKNPNDLDALLQQAEFFIHMGKYPEAEADLNNVLRMKSNSAEVHYVLAKLNQARGETLRYRDQLAEALRLNQFLLAVRIELAQSLLNGQNSKSALDVLDRTPEVQKSSLAVLIQRNWALWQTGDLQAMRKGIDSGLAAQRSVDLLIQDGLWKLKSSRFAEARAALEEALNLNPASVPALEGINQSYIAQKQPALGVTKIKETAARQPQSAPIQQLLGQALLATGDHAQARVAFAAAKTADPKSFEADLSLVQVDALERKWEDAEKRLKAILAVNDSSPTAHLWLGVVQEVKGNHTAAVEQFRRAEAADPNNPQTINNLAYLLAEYGNAPDEALQYAQKAVELAPDQPDYCDTLGWALYHKGLYPSAVKYLERASSKPDNVVWKYHLAMAYAKAGDLNHSRATLEAALKLNPNVPEAKVAQEVVEAAR